MYRLLYYHEYCKLSKNEMIGYDFWCHITNQENNFIDSKYEYSTDNR
jgi:hypothetical protein